MLSDNCLADICTDHAENKAKCQQNRNRFAVDRTEQRITVFRRITAVKKALAIVLCSHNYREVVCADPKAENAVTERRHLKALVAALFGNQIRDQSRKDDKRCAEPAHTSHKHDNCDQNGHDRNHAEFLDLRVKQHHRYRADQRDQHHIGCDNVRVDKAQHSAGKFHDKDQRRENADRDKVLYKE